MTSINLTLARQRLDTDLKNHLQRKSKKTEYSYTVGDVWVSEFSCYDSFLKLRRLIIFYEFSDLNSKPKKFTCVQDLYDFLKQSHISYPDYYLREDIKKNDILYMCCKKGFAELVCKKSYKELETEIH